MGSQTMTVRHLTELLQCYPDEALVFYRDIGTGDLLTPRPPEKFTVRYIKPADLYQVVEPIDGCKLEDRPAILI